MKHGALLSILLLSSCAMPQYVSKGTQNGVEIAYRWNHPVGKPSELWLRLKNTTDQDKHLDLGIDLYYQGRTVEMFEADTCLRAGQLLNGKLNGIYFIPERVTTAQIKDGSAEVETTRTLIEPASCP
ncbi:MAG: hypothetical protein KA941_08820 [Flavobacteriales bacterium]|nr:hypothetical protein [Flavobacteriales bacterium]